MLPCFVSLQKLDFGEQEAKSAVICAGIRIFDEETESLGFLTSPGSLTVNEQTSTDQNVGSLIPLLRH